jgi:hypothetical protein
MDQLVSILAKEPTVKAVQAVANSAVGALLLVLACHFLLLLVPKTSRLLAPFLSL